MDQFLSRLDWENFDVYILLLWVDINSVMIQNSLVNYSDALQALLAV